jgi:hypothetical protein
MAVASGGRSFPRPATEPKYQLRRLRARYGLHHFGAEFVTVAEWRTRSEAPNHCGHARLEQGWCFDDNDPDVRSRSIAKCQQEVRHFQTQQPMGDSKGTNPAQPRLGQRAGLRGRLSERRVKAATGAEVRSFRGLRVIITSGRRDGLRG